MVEALDIYTKLIVALLSFTTPVIVYLLSVFSDGIAIVRKKALEEEKQIERLIRTDAGKGNTDENFLKKVADNIQSLNDLKTKNQAKLDKLDPKKQIVKIFLTLCLSLLFVVAYVLVKDSSLKIYNHWVAVCLFCSSFLSFLFALWFLRCVAWEAIDTKKLIAEEESAEKIHKL